jgi:glucokinase
MYLGIEIGGSKLQLGIGPGDGTLTAFERLPVDPENGGAGIRRQILDAVPHLIASRLRGMAYGFGGPVDDATRRVLKSHQVEGWDDFPLAEWSEANLGLPCVLGNDCDVAGLAEALFGAGKGLSPVFYITVGSGIGGGLIIDGEIYRGCGKGAAEIGHLRLDGLHVSAAGGAMVVEGPLEEYASGWALQHAADHLIWQGEGRDSLLLQMVQGQSQFITAQHIGDAASRGDGFAKRVLHQGLRHLARGICHVIALLCPRRIVIGGGVSLMGDEAFFQPLRELVAEQVFAPFAGCYDIVPAALGEEVVVHGALALARRRFGA